MPSCQRLLADLNNAAASAAVTTTALWPAYRQAVPQPIRRQGHGLVRLGGAYVGAEDALLDLEIRPNAGGAARVTQPTFAGAGNGALVEASAEEGLAAQTVTVSCVDLGTQSTFAQVILEGDVLLRAKATGSAGNSLRLAVTPQLVLSAPIGALAAALSRGAQEWDDQRLDFGAVALDPDGAVPADAPRLVFGGDLSQVYRHYKRWDGDQWQYGVSPKLRADFAKDTRVYPVTGSYQCVLSGGPGEAAETFAGLTTLYSLLLALTGSALITVATPIGNDRKPNGMAAVEVPVRTTSFALPVIKSRDDLPALINVAVTATAPAETITLTCVDDAAVNAEQWTVVSQVLGPCPPATTGAPYVGDHLAFTIPKVLLEVLPVEGRFAITDRSFPRQTPDLIGVPDICLYRPILGSAGRDTTLKLIWTVRPPDLCDCTDARVLGGPVDDYLGIDLGDDDDMTLPAAYQTRLQALYAWRATFARNNTNLGSGSLYGATEELDLCDAIAAAFADALADEIYLVAAAAAEWDNALTAMQSDLAAIAAETGVAADGWPTSAKYLRAGTTLSVGDYVRAESDAVEPGFYKVTALIAYTALNQLGGVSSASLTFGDVTYNGPFNTIQIDPSRWLVDQGEGLLTCQSNPTYPTRIVVARAAPDAHLAGAQQQLDDFVRRYQAKMDQVRAMAGVVPKASAGRKGNAVWRDLGENYWRIDGTPYLPVFNNTYYHACVEQYDPVTHCTIIVPTLEFGFALRVSCAGRLQPGDTLTITIGDVVTSKPYRKDDRYEVPIVMGRPLAFSGGATGNETLTWAVASSTQGALAPYALPPAEPAYRSGGVGFRIQRGALPFALGDVFTFAVEAGWFRWRKNGGAWSADSPISALAVLSDGLIAAFVDGQSPSFVAGDGYQFLARQPYAPRNLLTADDTVWRWPGAAAQLTATFAAPASVECVGVLRHALPAGAAVTLTLRDALGAPVASVVLPAQPGPLLRFLDAPVTAVSLEVAVTGATDGALGWVYAGRPWAATHSANQCVLRRVYALARDAALNPRGEYLGAGRDGELTWDQWFMPADWVSLLALMDDCKAHGDRPVVVVPNLSDVQDAALVRFAADTLEVTDDYRFQDPTARQMSVTLPLTAVVT